MSDRITRNVEAERKALRGSAIDYSRLEESPLGGLITHLFTGLSGKYHDDDLLRWFLTSLHDDLDALGYSLGQSELGPPDNIEEILHRHANRCLLVIQLQDRLDEADEPEAEGETEEPTGGAPGEADGSTEAEAAEAEARKRFLAELATSPSVATAFQQWQQAEQQAFEARRDRRESELTNG